MRLLTVKLSSSSVSSWVNRSKDKFYISSAPENIITNVGRVSAYTWSEGFDEIRVQFLCLKHYNLQWTCIINNKSRFGRSSSVCLPAK